MNIKLVHINIYICMCHIYYIYMYACLKLRHKLFLGARATAIVSVGTFSTVCLSVCLITVCFVGMQMAQVCVCASTSVCQCKFWCRLTFSQHRWAFRLIFISLQPCASYVATGAIFVSPLAMVAITVGIVVVIVVWNGSSLHAQNMQFRGVVAPCCCLPAAQVSPIIMALSKYA